MTLLPIVLIPQVLFTFPAVQMDMKGPASLIARGMPTWWSYDLLRRIALAPDAQIPDETIEARLAEGKPALMGKARFESMLRDGFPMWSYRNLVEITWTASAPEKWSGTWGTPAIIDTAALSLLFLLLLVLVVGEQVRGTRPSG
jgi:hypothetical protein